MRSRDLYFRLLHYVLPYRKVFALSLLGTVVFAATEPAMPAFMKLLLDETFVARSESGLVLLPVLLVLLFVVRGIASFTGNVGMQWVATRVVMDLRTEMFNKLLTLPVWYFDNHASGNIISKYTFNVQRVTQAATSVLVTLVKDSLIVIGLLAWTLYINWQLSLIVLVIAPPTALIIRHVSKRLRKLARSLQDTIGELTRVIQETISSNREIKIFGGEDYEKNRFAKLNNQVRRYHMKASSVSEANVPVVQVLTVIALSIVIYIASVQSHTGQLTVGEFVSLIGALALMSSPIKRLTKINTQLQSGLAAAESVFALIDKHSERNDGKIRIDRSTGNIEFRHVSYTHHGSRSAVLHDINLEIATGETVALVGPSGGGKTTLASLLPRFYTPSAGTILLDGTDIQELELASLREQIAYVGQHIMLFNDTVAANIGYGAQAAASAGTIEQAAMKAHALEFIEELPDGMNTLVGENGVRLSAGQRQRIAIARALIKDTPILILDEATSALDSASEKMVQEALESLQQGRTSLVIAHRLSTIENADRILVMKAGRIVETGTHAELLDRNRLYARLYHLQHSREMEMGKNGCNQ
jgi:subfamily B ATP-binding cassette protein MsbA